MPICSKPKCGMKGNVQAWALNFCKRVREGDKRGSPDNPFRYSVRNRRLQVRWFYPQPFLIALFIV